MKINHLKIAEQDSFKDYKIKSESSNQMFLEFGKVNILIGSNNSGKSRFLRGLFSDKYVFFSDFPDIINKNLFEDLSNNILNEINEINEISHRELSLINEQLYLIREKNEANFHYNFVFLKSIRDYFEKYTEFEQIIEKGKFEKKRQKLERFFSSSNQSFIIEHINKIQDKLGEINDSILSNNLKFLYVPILRGMRPIAGGREYSNRKNEEYCSRTVNDYFGNNEGLYSSNHLIIYTGLSIYHELDNISRADKELRRIKKDFETFLSDNIFFDFVELTAKKGSDVVHVLIGEEEHEISNLGDGLQAIILLTFAIFIRKNENVIFLIEEPETHMHPSLQKKYLDVLLNQFPNHQYFLSTHSNHLMDAVFESEDVKLFSFNKKLSNNTFEIQPLEKPTVELLGELGVSNSSVLLSNCSIWVEGITDRLYLKAYLKAFLSKVENADKYGKYKEGLHYTFVEFSGSNFTHLDFENGENPDKIDALKINNKILLIHDSDYDDSGEILPFKQKRFDKLNQVLENDFIQLKCKEIENTLSPKVLIEVVKSYSCELKTEFENEDYSKLNLGQFIDDFLIEKNRVFRKDNSISDKTNFCQKAVKHILTIDDMTKEVTEMCEKIFLFIERNNKDYVFQNKG